MEPVHGGRDDWRSLTYSVLIRKTCRNGARPRRTGRRVDTLESLAELAAAMEPVHGGRDDRRRSAAPQRRARRRNGARPRRTGRPGRLPRTSWRRPRRNGARPRRTGRPLRRVALPRTGEAAMEPVHGGRDDAKQVRVFPVASTPQWSPSTEDGTTRPWPGGGPRRRRCRNGARPRRTGRPRSSTPTPRGSWLPQWSPSTEDGTTPCRRRTTRRSGGRNGARPRRTGRQQHDRVTVVDGAAAMEPVHGGRDDPADRGGGTPGARAAMEPVHGGRDDCLDLGEACGDARAAMEPVHGGRDDSAPSWCRLRT